MTIDNDVQSLLAMERYLTESKSDESILIDALAKLVQAHITPIKLHISQNLGGREWTFENTTCSIRIQNGTFNVRPRWQETRTYELANPDFPDNLLADIKSWLPK